MVFYQNTEYDVARIYSHTISYQSFKEFLKWGGGKIKYGHSPLHNFDSKELIYTWDKSFSDI